MRCDCPENCRYWGTITVYRGVGVYTLAKDVGWFPKAERRIRLDPKLLAEWEKGRAMSLEEAIAYALDDMT